MNDHVDPRTTRQQGAAVRFRCRLTGDSTPFPHHWERCVGSGHAALCLRADWQDQLRSAHEDLGFERVRFHGILSDDMGTFVEEGGQRIYSFHNATLITDYLLSIGMRPFMELSFMPTTLASGDKTVFAYRGNVTPPKILGDFKVLVGRLAAHFRERYGQREVERWLFEVWNEPNLEAFWTGGQQGYFDLYRATADALRAASPGMQVGGPATAKAEWIPPFVKWCGDNAVPLDFVTTHIYPTDALGGEGTNTTEQLAKSGRGFLRETAERTRREAGGLPVYYTEWNVTSNPHDPLHDQPFGAAYAMKAVFDLAGLVDGSSYWTFSDIFAENYFPSVPFHGGFGLRTLHGVPKPTYRAFQILHALGEERLAVEGSHPTVEAWAVRRPEGITIVIVNLALPGEPIATERVCVRIDDAPRPRSAFVERIDDDHANPRRRWIEWGGPDRLAPREVEELLSCSALRPEPVEVDHDGQAIELTIRVPPNGVAAITVEVDTRSRRKAEEEEEQRAEARSCSPAALRALVEPDCRPSRSVDAMLHELSAETFSYFIGQTREAGLGRHDLDEKPYTTRSPSAR
jgi:xylan 1,4-beta-xylosidase